MTCANEAIFEHGPHMKFTCGPLVFDEAIIAIYDSLFLLGPVMAWSLYDHVLKEGSGAH